MSFWLSAIPVQNCSLNLNVILKKAREIKAPQQSKLTPAPTIPTLRIARTPHSPLGIVATAREVVQEESHTYGEMTQCVRLFNNTLFPCGNLTHSEVAVSEDAGARRRTADDLSFCFVKFSSATELEWQRSG
jgi:hypothetical protein